MARIMTPVRDYYGPFWGPSGRRHGTRHVWVCMFSNGFHHFLDSVIPVPETIRETLFMAWKRSSKGRHAEGVAGPLENLPQMTSRALVTCPVHWKHILRCLAGSRRSKTGRNSSKRTSGICKSLPYTGPVEIRSVQPSLAEPPLVKTTAR